MKQVTHTSVRDFTPVTKEVLPKKVYFKKVDDLIICSGVYKHIVHPLKFSCV